MITEVGRYWPAVPPEEKWKEKTWGIFENGLHTALAYNAHQKWTNYEGTRQYGGVVTVAIGDACHRASDSGQDTTGLGRWSWVKLQGKLLGQGLNRSVQNG